MDDMSSLKQWDGKCGEYRHDPEQVKAWDMRKDTDGTIWYRTQEKVRQWSIWCPGNSLRSHMHHLEQIKAR